MSNRGKIYKNEEGLSEYRELKWFDSRGEYLGFDIIDSNGISINAFSDEDELIKNLVHMIVSKTTGGTK